MGRYLAIRIGRAALTIVLVVTFAFVVLRLSGDPALMILGPEAPPEVLAAFRKAWGLDDPIWFQYLDYFGAIAKGELGRSMRDGRPAIELVLERIPATLALTLPAFFFKVALGIPAGIYAALHRGSGIDRAVMMTAVAGFTVPSFVLALLLVLVFAVQLGWLPSGGQDSWRHAILPIVTLSLGGAAVLARFTRSAMLEVLGQPYIRTRLGQGRAVAQGGDVACAAERGDPDRHHPRLHGGHADRGRGRGRERVCLARSRAPAGRRRRQPRPRRRAVHPVAGRDDHGHVQSDRRFPLRLPRSAPARQRGARMTDATLKDAGVRRRISLPAIPVSVALAISWIVAMLVIAAFAEKIAPNSFTQLDLRNRLAAPGNVAHWLGTDELGRDVLSRLLVSIRISLLIAFGATAIAAIVGTTLGFLAAHFRGAVEQLVLMLTDFQASMPFLIMALAVLAFFGNSLPLLIGLMGLFGWERYARIARGLAISANAQGYAAAVRQLGATPSRIYLRHILPNIASTLIVSTTLVFPEVILMESGLSFLGLGVQPPMTSLGNMVGYGREYLTRAPWIMLAPATTIVITTLAVSVIGDWLRDRLDQTLQ
ncbi:ABC-type dipeptide/oligopeptide/nickel transport system permease subunit [Bradyrhizobium sp. i1.3.6]